MALIFETLRLERPVRILSSMKHLLRCIIGTRSNIRIIGLLDNGEVLDLSSWLNLVTAILCWIINLVSSGVEGCGHRHSFILGWRDRI